MSPMATEVSSQDGSQVLLLILALANVRDVFTRLPLPTLLRDHLASQFAGYNFTQVIALLARLDHRFS